MIPSPPAPSAATLPESTSHRWQPVRGGLLNLYRYDDQEFRYEAGRLVLRGNNGTGKSRVLALQLPFLLDGDISPQRVEPDGDHAKRMEWNLLMGGKYDDRLGYSWLEFGRRDEEGKTHYLTIGCGLRAVQGRGIAQQWFFITRQRIGRDLFLQNDQGQPHTKAKLESALGPHGRLFGSGRVEEDRRGYRQAVNEALFGLQDRYDALLNLLIQLRQPQLSRKLNEQVLSDALSEALPPLPDAVLGDVAEAFRSLENDQREIRDFTAARDGAEAFLKEYRRYIQIASRRRAEGVRKTNSAYEKTMRDLREAERNAEEANTAVATLETSLLDLEQKENASAAQEATLRDSPEMKSAAQLDQAREQMVAAQKEAREAGAALENAGRDLEKSQRQFEEAQAEADREWPPTAEWIARGQEAAASVGLSDEHAGALEQLRLSEGLSHWPRLEAFAGVLAETRQRLTRRVDQRFEAVDYLRKVNAGVAEARGKVQSAQQRYDDAHQALEESELEERKLWSDREKVIRKVLGDYHLWQREAIEHQPPEADALEEPLEAWCTLPEGRTPLEEAVHQAYVEATAKLSAVREEARLRHREAGAVLSGLQAQETALREGAGQHPPLPPTRHADARRHRPGAPFWALCDFAPSLPEQQRGPLEAALEAAGLLDAWVTPDGRLHDVVLEDTTLLLPGAPGEPVAGPTLAGLLRPDPSHPGEVPEAIVAALLERIGHGEASGAPVWVETDGQWQAGPLHGCWKKEEPQYIGHASREAARQRRLAELAREIEAAGAEKQRWEEELRKIGERFQKLEKERAQAPDDGNLRRALAACENARQTVTRQRVRLTEAETGLATRRRHLANLEKERDEKAADLRLTPWVDDLNHLAEALHRYRQAVENGFSGLRQLQQSCVQLGRARQWRDDAACRRDQCQQQLRERSNRAETLRAHWETLQRTVGVSARKVLDELADVRGRLAEIRREIETSRKEREMKIEARGRARSASERFESELAEREKTRAEAVEGLSDLARTGQLGVAHETLSFARDDGPSSISAAVDLARQIENLLHEVAHDDEAWKRSQSTIHQSYQTLETHLRAGGQTPDATMQGDLLVVSIVFQGRACTIAELRDALVVLIAERQELLNAQERKILENSLINEVADHLHNRLRDALKWVQEANEELASHPMETGMTLRFTWEPLAESAAVFTQARKLLIGERRVWSPQEREAVGDFLQHQIRTVRAADETGTWLEQLSAAFDYRKWHRFGVERRQDGVWKRLTRKTHGTGSGGEKAIALTLPQLAAAAAHYRSANPLAPRLILLDEAFVGVDKAMRAKCLNLLCSFDLDVLMTSESEWACYPTVPAIAIYQLSAREGVDAVYASRWVWNGRQRTRDETPAPGVQEPSAPAAS